VLEVDIPGRSSLRLAHAVFDLNGTLALDGMLEPGVPEAARAVGQVLRCLLLTSDTFGTGPSVARELGFDFRRAADGAEKKRVVQSLGANAVVAVGNGQNDAAMFAKAALAIAVLGPEGTAVPALLAADLAVRNILDAIGLLLNPTRLAATLRM
jgi:P-type E1-E2 ATPase